MELHKTRMLVLLSIRAAHCLYILNNINEYTQETSILGRPNSRPFFYPYSVVFQPKDSSSLLQRAQVFHKELGGTRFTAQKQSWSRTADKFKDWSVNMTQLHAPCMGKQAILILSQQAGINHCPSHQDACLFLGLKIHSHGLFSG